ncbi:uncharacterized protein LOC133799969 [Humulus lupulus]|uniref:uncharacterized protein LOC133799969 n=1 Tax=Humulus lupulus TaxID=3486 RepID=UPI002B401380|nr:uncharacterized protein LOC133799969 [Humulus lupulus]
MYTNTMTAKEIHEALEKKYKLEEECIKKFLYIEFKFHDNKPFLPQIHELQFVVNKFSTHDIVFTKQFLVGAIIAKLPSSWRGFRKKILHRNKDISLEEILKHLRIEEEYYSRDINEESNGETSKANAMANPPSKGKGIGKNKGKGQTSFKRNQNNEARVNSTQDELVATLSKVKVIHGRTLLKTFESLEEGHEIQMGIEKRSKVEGMGTIDLFFKSCKKVLLTNSFYVPEVSRNPVSDNSNGKP